MESFPYDQGAVHDFRSWSVWFGRSVSSLAEISINLLIGFDMHKINLLAKNIVKSLSNIAIVHSDLIPRWGVRNISREIPAITMNNGCKMPIIGLGTWGATDDFVEIENLGLGERKEKGVRSLFKWVFYTYLYTIYIEPNEMVEITKKAIDCGYRHFDTALMHGNEKQIGDAIQQKIKDDTVTRQITYGLTSLKIILYK
uniref:NADP-dependent oxidoreductase domain-containing protein n=1 Tax=Glossina palpalis gambiensis TaxID=67801 RepID=A0A1B0BMD5_9MUSC